MWEKYAKSKLKFTIRMVKDGESQMWWCDVVWMNGLLKYTNMHISKYKHTQTHTQKHLY